jgi:spermidine/putrescine transport system permease protein/putrescine transport system permease protein
MLKTGVTPEINALGTVLVAFNLVAVVAIGVRQLRGVLSGAPQRQEGR